MRLLNVKTLELKEFPSSKTPKYSILSHRWASDEVSFEEYQQGLNKDGDGYRKITGFCKFVRDRKIPDYVVNNASNRVVRQSVEWIWIDTCSSHNCVVG